MRNARPIDTEARIGPPTAGRPRDGLVPGGPASHGSGYDIVLFDLGGVLVELGGVASLRELSGIDSDDEIWHRWLTSPWVRRFERGRCTPQEFAAGLVEEWGLPTTPEHFLERFREWPESLYDGAVELVADVAARCRVGCLSNTNELFWSDQAPRWGLAELFDVVFLSYQLDLIKPDPEIFSHVTDTLGLPPGRILLLDDRPVNVERALAAGLAGALVEGPDAARSALVGFGVLP